MKVEYTSLKFHDALRLRSDRVNVWIIAFGKVEILKVRTSMNARRVSKVDEGGEDSQKQSK